MYLDYFLLLLDYFNIQQIFSMMAFNLILIMSIFSS